MTDQAVQRNEKGHFVKGSSGNPAGRPQGAKNHIVMLRENTELALREYLASPASAKKALEAIDRCMTIAIEGDAKQALGAMKLLFDKLLPNAKASEEAGGGKQRPVAITIINSTDGDAGSPVTVIDGESVDIG
jgi:hypothetical protein